jgi:hypothetical protein
MFWVLAKLTRLLKRRIDTTVTKAPTLNMSKTPTFFFVVMCRFQICEIGKANVMISITIPMPACAKARLLLLTQRPSCSPSHWVHAKLIGLHTNTAATEQAKVAARLTVMQNQTTLLNLFKGKICRKNIRNEVFTRPIQAK